MLRAFDAQGNRSLDLTEFTRLHEFLSTVSASFQYFDQVRQDVYSRRNTTNHALQHQQS